MRVPGYRPIVAWILSRVGPTIYSGVQFVLLLPLRMVDCQYRYHFPRQRCLLCPNSGCHRCPVRHLLLVPASLPAYQWDRWRLQTEKGAIAAVVVIVVKSVDLNRKSLDELYVSGLVGRFFNVDVFARQFRCDCVHKIKIIAGSQREVSPSAFSSGNADIIVSTPCARAADEDSRLRSRPGTHITNMFTSRCLPAVLSTPIVSFAVPVAHNSCDPAP